MALLDYPLWKDIGVQLRDYKYKKNYVNPEQYLLDNPLTALVVPAGIENFFGTKVLNIHVIARPYGWVNSGSTWTESWPPDGLNAAITRHKEMYKKFAWYETHMYMDFNIVNKVMAVNSNSNFRDMMNSVKSHISDVCTQLASFGFTLESDITTEVDADYFKPVIDTFKLNSA